MSMTEGYWDDAIRIRMKFHEAEWASLTALRDKAIKHFPPGHQFDFCGKQMTVVYHTIKFDEHHVATKCKYLNNAGELRENWLCSDEFPFDEWLNNTGQSQS